MKTMETALAELRAAQAEREAPAAGLAKLEAEYAELGRQASHATTQVEVTEAERAQYHVANRQTSFVQALKKIDARIRAARLAVGKAAE